MATMAAVFPPFSTRLYQLISLTLRRAHQGDCKTGNGVLLLLLRRGGAIKFEVRQRCNIIEIQFISSPISLPFIVGFAHQGVIIGSLATVCDVA